METTDTVIAVFADHDIQCETALKADNFLVMAHGTAAEMARAKALLDTVNPTRLDLHQGMQPPVPAVHAAA